jgi:hypothetical protein
VAEEDEDDELEQARIADTAKQDQILAAFFGDEDLPRTLEEISALAAQCVDRLCERGVQLDNAVSIVVGGITGTIVRHYSQ